MEQPDKNNKQAVNGSVKPVANMFTVGKITQKDILRMRAEAKEKSVGKKKPK